MLLEAYSFQHGKDDKSGSPGVIYYLATQESWRRAKFEVKNARRLLEGKKEEPLDPKALKTNKEAEIAYLSAEATKSLESQR